MRFGLDNAVLVDDLDFGNFNLDNVASFYPIPPTIAGSNDSRLSDQRNIRNNSVTNTRVSASAAIDQSKLLLNGIIPTNWLGANSVRAAQGNLVERVASKNAVSGYVGLDSTGKFSSAQLPSTGPNAGTVTEAILTVSASVFHNITINIIHGAGTWSAVTNTAPNNTWLGVDGLDSNETLTPQYLSGAIPIGIVPSLPASKFTTGVFALQRLPTMQPIGVNHAVGILPDPMDGMTGSALDYFARDGKFHNFIFTSGVQPTLPNPDVYLAYISGGLAYVTISSKVPNVNLFYQVLPAISTTFTPIASSTIAVAEGSTVRVYAAKSGYNNSNIVEFMVPSPATL